MAHKRSKGVTFWAWVFILISVWGIVDSFLNYQKIIKESGMILFVITFLLCIAYIICGTLLLKLKEMGRKAVIYLGIISIIMIPLYFKSMIEGNYSEKYYTERKQAIMEQMKPEHQQKALKDLEKEYEISKKVTPWFVGGLVGVPILILELIPIWFFTRPKVKEQFGTHEVSA